MVVMGQMKMTKSFRRETFTPQLAWHNFDSPLIRETVSLKPLNFFAAEVESCIEGMKSKNNMVSFKKITAKVSVGKKKNLKLKTK